MIRGLLLGLLSTAVSAVELLPIIVPGTTVTLAVPANWNSVAPADGTIIRLVNRAHDAGMAVSVTPLLANEGPAGFTRRTLADLQHLVYEFDLLDWNFTLPVGARTWSRLHFRMVSGNQHWEEWLYLTADSGQGIAVAFSAAPAAWSAWAPIFENVVHEAGSSRPVLTPLR